MKKRTPSIVEQARQGIAALDKWAKGETRFRVTMAAKDGTRTTFRATRDELNAKIKRAESFKKIRAEMDLSQPEIAQLLHVGPGTVKGWEIARRAIPENVMVLATLAKEMPAVRKRLEAMTLGAPPSMPAGGAQKRATA